MGFPGGSVIKNPPANAEDEGLILRLGRSPGEANGNPLCILAWKIPWTEEPGGLQPMGSLRVGPTWALSTHSKSIRKGQLVK